jgi:uncharacterized membrane protein YphA (DoxX/SURF4 family)
MSGRTVGARAQSKPPEFYLPLIGRMAIAALFLLGGFGKIFAGAVGSFESAQRRGPY